MPAKRILITGFGPFPGMPRNPSGGIARRVAALPRWRILGIEARALVLSTTYAALDDVLAPVLEEGFDAVLMIGVAGRSRRVRVETRATNRISILFPDAAGTQPTALARKSRPPARKAGVDPWIALVALRRSGIDARLSRDAGRYLCNASYYRALAEASRVLFVHIPKPPRNRPCPRLIHRRLGWEDRLASGLADVAARMLAGSRGVTAERRMS